MLLKTLILQIIAIIPLAAGAQHSAVFHQSMADLGVIIDNQGIVSQQFTFTNESSDSILVEKVTTSCGCTSSNWTSEVIGPGTNGFVEIQMDPFNRPGPFEKYAFVHFRDAPDSVVLAIMGFVEPGVESVAEAFPIKMGSMRVKKNSLDLGTITKRTLFSKSFEVYNDSEEILVFADDMQGPNHITVTFEPYTLRPKSKGKIWIHYDIAAKNDLGYFQEHIAISTYESDNAKKDFEITTTILDIPEGKTGASPRIHFAEKEKDFGIRQQGDTINVQYTVQNTGKSVLQLKKVFGNCNCIRVIPERYKINPGESASIDVRFYTTDRLGNQEKTVTVFTDDPSLPVAILKLKGRLRGPRD